MKIIGDIAMVVAGVVLWPAAVCGMGYGLSVAPTFVIKGIFWSLIGLTAVALLFGVSAWINHGKEVDW